MRAGSAIGWGYGLGIVAALFAGLSYLADVNRYVGMFGREMSGAYDCDGPLSVGMFVVPAVLLSIAGVIITTRVVRRQPALIAFGAFLLSAFVLVAAVVRVPPVIVEHRKNMQTGSPCR